jgi:alpha-tubulin suppressor-like RCC1 family protein
VRITVHHPSEHFMIRHNSFFSAILLLLLAACDEQPVATRSPLQPQAPSQAVAQLRCSVNVWEETLSCADTNPAVNAGDARLGLLTVGRQNHHVRLSNRANSYDAGTGVFTTLVTVQNLLATALGTADGVTVSPLGVRVFFATGPTAPVTIANPDGEGMFTAADQPYFQYSGLGGDGVLEPGEVSEGKYWRFVTNGAGAFSFTVYVQAEVDAAAPTTLHFEQISTGAMHSCAVTSDGDVYCWGSNPAGQLGRGTRGESPNVPLRILAPREVSFTTTASGNHYTCAVTTMGGVYCWGNGPGEMAAGMPGGDRLEPFAITMPPGVTFDRIAAGTGHVCALTPEGAAYCWGGNGQGQLGNGTLQPYEQPTPAPVAMPTGVAFMAISSQGPHTCALGSDGEVYCWGDGSHGQVGDGLRLLNNPMPTRAAMPQSERAFTAVAAGGAHSCAIGSSGMAYCWGNAWRGQLGIGSAPDEGRYAPVPVQMPQGVTFTGIWASSVHTCALASGGKAYCWGEDLYQQLGNGATLTSNQLTPSAVVMPAGVTFREISGHSIHGCAVTNGPAYCWGSNYFMSLGDGTQTDRAVPTVVAGTR